MYETIQKTILHKFSSKKFYGYWSVVLDQEYNYKYDDKVGEELRRYNEHIVDFLKKTPAHCNAEEHLWDLVFRDDKKRLEDIITQTPEKTKAENWSGVKWKLVVYQKHSFPQKWIR